MLLHLSLCLISKQEYKPKYKKKMVDMSMICPINRIRSQNPNTTVY